MTPKQLKKIMSQLDISQADLSRICFNQVTQSDRNIVSTWLSGAKPIPRWLPQLLNYYKDMRNYAQYYPLSKSRKESKQ